MKQETATPDNYRKSNKQEKKTKRKKETFERNRLIQRLLCQKP